MKTLLQIICEITEQQLCPHFTDKDIQDHRRIAAVFQSCTPDDSREHHSYRSRQVTCLDTNSAGIIGLNLGKASAREHGH